MRKRTTHASPKLVSIDVDIAVRRHRHVTASRAPGLQLETAWRSHTGLCVCRAGSDGRAYTGQIIVNASAMHQVIEVLSIAGVRRPPGAWSGSSQFRAYLSRQPR